VWSEKNNEVALKVAREIYANDFIVHNWAGDSTGGLQAFNKDLIDNRADSQTGMKQYSRSSQKATWSRCDSSRLGPKAKTSLLFHTACHSLRTGIGT
jgi:hypothetical protein